MSGRHAKPRRAGWSPARSAAVGTGLTATVTAALTAATGLYAPAALAATHAPGGTKPPPAGAKPTPAKAAGKAAPAKEAAKPAPPKVVPVTVQVAQKNLSFNPTELKLNTGDTVIWTNKEADDTTHSVVQGNGADIDSPDIQPGQSFTWKFEFPGEWDIICRFHPAMFLTIIVGGEAVPGAKAPMPQHVDAPPPAKPKDGDSTIPGLTGLPLALEPPTLRH
jgi:plastocyanin